MRARWLMMVVLFLPLGAASAQLAELQPGVKVRVRAPGAVAGTLTGVVVSRTTDSVTVTRSNAPPLAMPFSSLATVDISRGKSRARGALKGALWGAGVGVLLGFTPITEEDCTDSQFGRCEPLTRGEFLSAMVLGSVVIALPIGAVIGSERWERLTLPGRVAVVVSPAGHRAGLAVHW